MRRRQVLTTFFTGVCAGCVGVPGGKDGPATGTPTDTGTGTATPTPAPTPVDPGTNRTVDGAPVTVTSITVRDSVVYAAYPDALGVRSPTGRYVFVGIETTAAGPSRRAFSLVAGDLTVDELAWFNGPVEGFDQQYSPGAGRHEGWIAFEAPAPLEADRASITVGNAEWRIPANAMDRLARPKPTYAIEELQVPGAVAPGEPFSIAATVGNDSEVAGNFRGVVVLTGGGFRHHLSEAFALDLDPGERDTWQQQFGTGDQEPKPGLGPIDLRFKTPLGDRERAIEVREPTSGK